MRCSKKHFYSIISSARPSNGSGNVMPRALAVEVQEHLTFVACWTAGRRPSRHWECGQRRCQLNGTIAYRCSARSCMGMSRARWL